MSTYKSNYWELNFLKQATGGYFYFNLSQYDSPLRIKIPYDANASLVKSQLEYYYGNIFTVTKTSIGYEIQSDTPIACPSVCTSYLTLGSNYVARFNNIENAVNKNIILNDFDPSVGATISFDIRFLFSLSYFNAPIFLVGHSSGRTLEIRYDFSSYTLSVNSYVSVGVSQQSATIEWKPDNLWHKISVFLPGPASTSSVVIAIDGVSQTVTENSPGVLDWGASYVANEIQNVDITGGTAGNYTLDIPDYGVTGNCVSSPASWASLATLASDLETAINTLINPLACTVSDDGIGKLIITFNSELGDIGNITVDSDTVTGMGYTGTNIEYIQDGSARINFWNIGGNTTNDIYSDLLGSASERLIPYDIRNLIVFNVNTGGSLTPTANTIINLSCNEGTSDTFVDATSYNNDFYYKNPDWVTDDIYSENNLALHWNFDADPLATFNYTANLVSLNSFLASGGDLVDVSTSDDDRQVDDYNQISWPSATGAIVAVYYDQLHNVSGITSPIRSNTYPLVIYFNMDDTVLQNFDYNILSFGNYTSNSHSYMFLQTYMGKIRLSDGADNQTFTDYDFPLSPGYRHYAIKMTDDNPDNAELYIDGNSVNILHSSNDAITLSSTWNNYSSGAVAGKIKVDADIEINTYDNLNVDQLNELMKLRIGKQIVLTNVGGTLTFSITNVIATKANSYFYFNGNIISDTGFDVTDGLETTVTISEPTDTTSFLFGNGGLYFYFRHLVDKTKYSNIKVYLDDVDPSDLYKMRSINNVTIRDKRSLSLQYYLQESSGTTALDYSGNGYDLTLSGTSATWDSDAPNSFGRSLYLTGTGLATNTDVDFGVIPDAYTAIGWIKVTGGSGTDRTILSLGDEGDSSWMNFLVSTANKLYSVNQDEEAQDDNSLSGSWMHVAIVYNIVDVNKFKFYIDGNDVTDIASGSTNFYTGKSIRQPIKIGPFNSGKFADIRYYEKPLTDSEVLSIYNSYYVIELGMTGGADIQGNASFYLLYNTDISGGAIVDQLTSSAFLYNPSAQIDLVVSNTSATTIDSPCASGGILASGMSDTQELIYFSGGIIATGSAQTTQKSTPVISGGAIVNFKAFTSYKASPTKPLESCGKLGIKTTNKYWKLIYPNVSKFYQGSSTPAYVPAITTCLQKID
jgi:hypothetical protein